MCLDPAGRESTVSERRGREKERSVIKVPSYDQRHQRQDAGAPSEKPSAETRELRVREREREREGEKERERERERGREREREREKEKERDRQTHRWNDF